MGDVGEYFFLRHEEDEIPSRIADGLHSIEHCDILIASLEEERLSGEIGLLFIGTFILYVVIERQHRMADEAAVRIEHECFSRLADLEGGDLLLNAFKAHIGCDDAEEFAVAAHGFAQGHDLVVREVVHVYIGKLYAVVLHGFLVPIASRRVEFSLGHDTFFTVKKVALGKADEERVDVFALHEAFADGSKCFVAGKTVRPRFCQAVQCAALGFDHFVDLLGIKLGKRHHLAFRGFLQKRARIPIAEYGHSEEDDAEGNSDPKEKFYS